MSYYKELIGDRIYLSPKGISDDELGKFTEWMNDFDTTDYIGRSGKICAIPGEKDWLENSAKDADNRNFDIVELNTDRLIGGVGLVHFDWIERSATLGVMIGDPDFRSHGYGTEAIKLLLDYGFNYLNLHSVNLSLLDCNERAHKCYLKCGFKDAGRLRNKIFINGKYYDELIMDILEDEFTESYIRNKNVGTERETANKKTIEA